MRNGTKVETIDTGEEINDLENCKDALVSAHRDGTLRFWSTTNFKLIRTLTMSSGSINCLIRGTGFSRLMFGTEKGYIFRFDYKETDITKFKIEFNLGGGYKVLSIDRYENNLLFVGENKHNIKFITHIGSCDQNCELTDGLIKNTGFKVETLALLSRK